MNSEHQRVEGLSLTPTGCMEVSVLASLGVKAPSSNLQIDGVDEPTMDRGTVAVFCHATLHLLIRVGVEKMPYRQLIILGRPRPSASWCDAVIGENAARRECSLKLSEARCVHLQVDLLTG